MKREIRSAALAVQNGKTVGGYAAIFNSPATIAGEWVEVIASGAFAETLGSGQDVLALYSHEIERLLGRRSSGTLRLVEDAKGLAIEIDLPDTTDGRDVGVLIERGDLSGMSFGFIVTKQSWDTSGDLPVRTIESVDLREVTITADPAYADTEIGMRSLEEARSIVKKVVNFNNAERRLQRKAELDMRERKT
jgi:HK97 family phage prohead protease